MVEDFIFDLPLRLVDFALLPLDIEPRRELLLPLMLPDVDEPLMLPSVLIEPEPLVEPEPPDIVPLPLVVPIEPLVVPLVEPIEPLVEPLVLPLVVPEPLVEVPPVVLPPVVVCAKEAVPRPTVNKAARKILVIFMVVVLWRGKK